MGGQDEAVGEAGVGTEELEPAGDEAEQASSRAGSVWVAARVVATGLGAAAVVCAVGAGEWLEARAALVLFLVPATLVALWWPPPRARAASLWAAALAVTAAVVLVSGLGRATEFPDERGRGAEVAGHVAGEVPTGPVLGRISDRDLPPKVAYVAGVTVVGLAAVAVSLALQRLLARRPGPARRTRSGVAVGVLVTAAMLPAVVAGGSAARATADRRAEADSLLHEVARPAGRFSESPGPVEPLTLRWEVSWPERYGSEMQFNGVAAVPGWDAMVGYVRSPSSVVAFSKTDGSELWRYGRRDGLIGGITVDPEAGRVLVLSGEAAVVLDLRDGSELLARRLPFEMDAPGVVSGGGFLVGPDYTLGLGDGGPMVAVGSSAVVAAHPTLAVIDVSSGELQGSRTDSSTGCSYTRYATTSTPSPVIVQWGLAVDGSECGNPTLLALGDGGRIEPVAEIPPPSEASIVHGCYEADCGRLAVTGDTIVLLNQWATPSGLPASEFVVLSSDGSIRWRTPLDATAGYRALAGTTETGVITWSQARCTPPCRQPDGQWRLLALADGTELAHQPSTEGFISSSVTDDERLYVSGGDGVTVRQLDDLAQVGTSTRLPRSERLFATSGVLVGLDDDSRDPVGYSDGPASAS